MPRVPPTAAFVVLLDTGLTPKGDLSPGTSHHGDHVYLPPTLRTIQDWGTRTGPFGFASSCRARWPGRGWSRRGDTRTACAGRGSRVNASPQKPPRQRLRGTGQCQEQEWCSWERLSPSSPQTSSEAASLASNPGRTERDASDLQNVHDDAEGPHVTGLVVLLRAQHLRGW